MEIVFFIDFIVHGLLDFLFMDVSTFSTERLTNLRLRSTLGVAVIALLVMRPFAINNFIQGRLLMGTGSSAVIIL